MQPIILAPRIPSTRTWTCRSDFLRRKLLPYGERGIIPSAAVGIAKIWHARAPGCNAPGRFRAHRLNLGPASMCVAIYNLSRQAAEPAPSGNTLLHVSLLPLAITCQVLRRNTTVGGAERVLPGSFPFGFDSLLPRKAPFCSLSFLITILVSKDRVKAGGRGLMANALCRIP